MAVLVPYRKPGTRDRPDRLRALLASGHVAPAERLFASAPRLTRGRGRLPSRLIAERR